MKMIKGKEILIEAGIRLKIVFKDLENLRTSK